MAKRRQFQTSVTTWLDPEDVAILDRVRGEELSRSGYVTQVIRAHLTALESGASVQEMGAPVASPPPSPAEPPPQTPAPEPPAAAAATATTAPAAATPPPGQSWPAAPASSRTGSSGSSGTSAQTGGPATTWQRSRPSIPPRPGMAGMAASHRLGRSVPPEAAAAGSVPTQAPPPQGSETGTNADGAAPTPPSSSASHRPAAPINEDERMAIYDAIMRIRSRAHHVRVRRPPLSVKQLLEAVELSRQGCEWGDLANRYGCTASTVGRSVAEVEEELSKNGSPFMRSY